MEMDLKSPLPSPLPARFPPRGRFLRFPPPRFPPRGRFLGNNGAVGPIPGMMSVARPILPGVSHMVTRRCTQRQFLLLPSARVNEVFLYCLALAQASSGVAVHVAVVMSNHYHLIVTDLEGNLPEFTYVLNKYVAKCLNVHYEREENFWAGGTQTSYVELGDDEALLDKSVYAVCNPVTAGLVSRSASWEGVCLWRPGGVKVRRPPVFFRDEGPMPASLKLRLTPIPLSEGLKQRALMQRLGQAVAEREAEVRGEFRQEGRRFLIRAQDASGDSITLTHPTARLPSVASHPGWPQGTSGGASSFYSALETSPTATRMHSCASALASERWSFPLAPTRCASTTACAALSSDSATDSHARSARFARTAASGE